MCQQKGHLIKLKCMRLMSDNVVPKMPGVQRLNVVVTGGLRLLANFAATATQLSRIAIASSVLLTCSVSSCPAESSSGKRRVFLELEHGTLFQLKPGWSLAVLHALLGV